MLYNSCLEDEDGVHRGEITINSTTKQMTQFTMKNDGQVVDLVAITANDKTCPEEQGVTIEVSDATADVAKPSRP